MNTNYQKFISASVRTILFMLFLGAISISAAPGDLDPTFGAGGIITTTFPKASTATDVAVQADGKILIVGSFSSILQPNDPVILARYNYDGSLDDTFGNAGKATATYFHAQEFSSIAIQADGRIVIAGTALDDPDDFLVARFETNGMLDASFGQEGFARINFGHYDSAGDIAIQPDGKIVIAGGSSNDAFAVARHPNGALDDSFGGDGRVTTSLGASGSRAFGLALQTDGKIVAAGVKGDSSGNSGGFALVRYHPNGSLDSAFDGDGIAITSIGSGYDAAYDVAIQPDGKIVAAGETHFPVSSSGFLFAFGIARYNTDGTLDASFDGDGIAVTYVTNTSSPAYSLAIQQDGKMLAAGMLENMDMNYSGVLVRYNTNGSLDASFGGGIINGIGDWFLGTAIQRDGKIVAAGAGSGDVLVARFAGDTAISNRPFFDFDGDGKADISVFRPSNGEWWYSRSSDSMFRAAQFGSNSDKPVPADYTGDGKTDIAVFRPASGEWFILRSEDGSYYSFPFGIAEDIPFAADFDADGKADAVFRPSSSTWFINKSAGGTIIRRYGTGGDYPVAADYDGDGRADIAVWRPSSGEWWIERSSDETTIVYQFGTSTDRPVPADYTGDGKTDAAVFRPVSGEWFFLRSENLSYYSFPFGVATDLPAPADYDGDGRADAAVFRGGIWYLLESTNGVSIRQFGLPDDKPVPAANLP